MTPLIAPGAICLVTNEGPHGMVGKQVLVVETLGADRWLVHGINAPGAGVMSADMLDPLERMQ